MSTDSGCVSLVEELLLKQYGPFLDSAAICKVLYYPTRGALAAAKARGQLPFTPIKLGGRPGIFALTSEIAEIAERLASESRSQAKESGVTSTM
ncbi:hypothetical protein [Piscinibacter gummiphilus]|uniref:Pyocin activator protein PrtN n=1 Tax=Piscinibacter gummiphilus TaxID=946333 RepID=A0ABZ0CLR1_9BURK|nr:hypothetical protein [Piscinibacter gummiphilus]WOB05900.1 hypothetical protein RXV79_13315 [Piscinibacter gummiphilus]